MWRKGCPKNPAARRGTMTTVVCPRKLARAEGVESSPQALSACARKFQNDSSNATIRKDLVHELLLVKPVLVSSCPGDKDSSCGELLIACSGSVGCELLAISSSLGTIVASADSEELSRPIVWEDCPVVLFLWELDFCLLHINKGRNGTNVIHPRAKLIVETDGGP